MISSRHSAILLRVAIVFAIALPLVSQDEEPYFSLSSSETFGSGAQASVGLSAFGVNAVRIRVYRINDPVQFMRQTADAHQFGGRYSKPGGKLTLLERIHNWKRSLRRDVRYNLRHEFTESPGAHFAWLWPGKTMKQGNGATYFAEAPVLNPQQLVLSFLQPVSPQPNRWDTQKVSIPVKDKGVFLVEAVHNNLQAYTVLVVSDIVLMTKTGRDRILYYVANRKTGEPIGDAAINTLERDSRGTSLRTAADGTSEYRITDAPANDLRVIATKGGDAAFGDLEPWSLNRGAHSLIGLVYTDRPVYRPGDITHFRAILRNQQATGYTVPAGGKFAVQIMDRDGKAVYQKDLTANSQGILHDEIALAKDAALGSYYIEVRSGENTANGNFQVEEYKKPEYEVHVTPESGRVLQGQSTKLTIDSRYYFGEPVAGAKVKYSVYRSRYWFPLWYEPDEDSPEENSNSEPDDYGQNQEATQTEGQLDSEGKLNINLPTIVAKDKSDTLYRIEAGVTDQAGREISGTGWVVATYGSFVINVQPDRWFYQPSSIGSFKIETRDYDRKPVAAPVHLELRSYNWRDRTEGKKLAESDTQTGADGTGAAELKLPANGGDYRLIATAPSDGRIVESETYVWVAGSSDVWGGAGETERSIPIVPDKKSYRPGETAQIMIAAGQDNTPVLVTVEGRDIRSHTLLRSKGGTAIFSYQVSASDEPSVFVSAQYFRDGLLYQSNKRVKVPPEDHKLAIKLETDKAQYQPAHPVTYNLDVTTPDGKPAAQTDLSLSVVDEAIYAIAKDQTPSVLDTFYGREYNSVSTENSLTYYFTGEAGTRRMQLAKLAPNRALAQLKPEQLVRPKVRKYFPDTAFWAADLTTDSTGHAQAKFDFPDSLTTWRATARGSSVDDRYGSATLKTIVRKNLMVRLAVPRFFIEGDEVVISAIVHNYLKNDKKVRVDLKAEGLDLLNGASPQEVMVVQRGEAKVDWRVKARSLRKAKLTAEALTNEESDSLEVELPINLPGLLIRDPHAGSIADSGTANFSVTYPANAVQGSRSLSVRLSPSVAGSIFSALGYLTSFPYGCVEQTMSSFLPDVVVRQAVHDLALKQSLSDADLNQKIQAGLQRLYGFRHEDGGWGWWASDDSHPFMTAYVVWGLSAARSAGIAVDADAIEKGAKWIAGYLQKNGRLPADLRAYMAYALADSGHADANALNQVYRERSDLSSYGAALLGLAFEDVHDGRAGEIAAGLESSAQTTATEASWVATRDEMLDFSADVTPEATAYATKLLSHQRPKSSLLPKAALWLVNHRNEGYWWSSTKQTAMVIYGLTDYLKASNELHADIKATVQVNGQPAGTVEFASGNVTGEPAITLDESKLKAGANVIQLQTSGSGRVYYSISADHYSNDPKSENQGTIALNILRDYYTLAPDKTGDAIVYDLQPLNGAVSQGDVLAVRLTVTGSDWRYLLVEDPIPAGTEFVKDDSLYHLKSAPDWWQTWFTERENHDDHVAIFDSYFDRRQTQYFYLLKVVNPGLFHINPASVRPMYQPGHEATTAAATLEVR